MPNEAPLISIVMPTYNHSKFIGEAIHSIINQTYKNWELIIINNYSTDNTVDVINSFKDSRISLVNFKNNGIIASSRNEGIRRSSGEYIAFIDSDDIWMPKKLEEQLCVFKKYSDLLLVSSNAIFLSNSIIKKIKRYLIITLKNIRPSFKDMLFYNYVIQSTVIIKKELAKQIGYIDENINLKSVEDYDYWLRIIEYKSNSIYVLKKALIKYRVHAGNTFSSGAKEFDKIKIIYEKYKIKYPELIGEVLKARDYKAKLIDLRENYCNRKINIKTLFSAKDICFYDKFIVFIWALLKRL
jgi:glycosyltransferase involved in cell wall biosynthesis